MDDTMDGSAAWLGLDMIKRPPEATRCPPVNVAQVRHLSPFRYPGGKTWCVPTVRRWLNNIEKPSVFVEPFAGGAIVGLTVAVENLADRVVLGELDADVASVWQIAFDAADKDFEWLCRTILEFEISLQSVTAILDGPQRTLRDRAFRTIVKNRVQRGGILAPGASLVKSGENGKGLASRWYPQTLVTRLRTIRAAKSRISFFNDDAFKIISRYKKKSSAAFFVDPPYTAGGKKAGSRLYAHSEIDHVALFELLGKTAGALLATYDDAPEVRALVAKQGFQLGSIMMKSTHHALVQELLITKT